MWCDGICLRTLVGADMRIAVIGKCNIVEN